MGVSGQDEEEAQAKPWGEVGSIEGLGCDEVGDGLAASHCLLCREWTTRGAGGRESWNKLPSMGVRGKNQGRQKPGLWDIY